MNHGVPWLIGGVSSANLGEPPTPSCGSTAPITSSPHSSWGTAKTATSPIFGKPRSTFSISVGQDGDAYAYAPRGRVAPNLGRR